MSDYHGKYHAYIGNAKKYERRYMGIKMGNDGISIWQLIILIIILIPLIQFLASSRSHGVAKFGWSLAVLFFTWLGCIVFLIVTQSAKDAQAAGSSKSRNA